MTTPSLLPGTAVLSACLSALPAQDQYRFTIDGQEASPRIVSLRGDPDHPEPGDLAELGGVLIPLPAAPGLLAFRGDVRQDGRLELVRGDAATTVAVNAATLTAIDAAARKDLRAVYVDQWNDRVAAAIAALSPEVALTVTSATAQGTTLALPPLPAHLRFLSLHQTETQGFADFLPAQKLVHLQVLHLGGNYSKWVLDLRPFAAAGDLRALIAGDQRLYPVAAIAAFGQLREFACETDFEGDTLDMFAGLHELRRCHVDPQAGQLLLPLAGLPQLTHLDIGFFCRVSSLPAQGFPALRSLRFLGSDVPVADVRAFRAQHPLCRIEAPPEQALLASAIASCDRIRVEPGEPLAFTVTGADAVRAAVARFQIREDGRYARTCCFGGPTFEFQQGERTLARLTLHHGRSIQWNDGPWMGTAFLTEACAEALCAWLAEHRIDGPLRERNGARAGAAARRLRLQLRAGVAGKAGAALDDAGDAAGAWTALALDGTDAARATLAVRLLGCHFGAWDQPDRTDQLLSEALAANGPAVAWPQLVEAAKTDAHVARGIAALFVEEAKGARVPERFHAELLPLVGSAGLGHPQPFNRRRMLQILRDLPGEPATAVLRRALVGHAPQPVKAEELISPGGMVLVHPSDDVLLDEEASLPALAAVCLAARGDRESLAAIRALAATSSGHDRELCERAAAKLSGR